MTGEKSMTQKSLHEIMNEIVGRIDTLDTASLSPFQNNEYLKPSSKQQKPKHGKVNPLSEIDAFMQLDSLLAQLHKQYLEAKVYRQDLIKANGSNDPMSEIAIDMEDSAYCAFQTRYIEMRQIREMMAKAQRLMRESVEEIERDANIEREKQFRNFILLSKMQEKLRLENQQGGFGYAILLIMFNLTPMSFSRKPAYVQKMAA